MPHEMTVAAAVNRGHRQGTVKNTLTHTHTHKVTKKRTRDWSFARRNKASIVSQGSVF